MFGRANINRNKRPIDAFLIFQRRESPMVSVFLLLIKLLAPTIVFIYILVYLIKSLSN